MLPSRQNNMDFIKNIRLPKIAQRHPVAFSVAIALHLLILIGLFFSNIQRLEKVEEQVKKTTTEFIPKAVTIDLSEIKREKKRLVDIQKKKAAKIKYEEKRLRKLEDERYKKQRKINQLKAKAKKEKKAKKIAEKKRKAAEKKAKDAERKVKDTEKKRKIADKKFKEEQKKYDLIKQAEFKKEQERKLAQAQIINELKLNYINQIASRVRKQWRYEGGKDDWGCEVYIAQDKDGKVQSVNLKSCNIDNNSKVKSFKNAIKRAVMKASPLPSAPDKSVFDREVIFHFRVN